MSYTHLQVRSGYSLYKSTMTIDAIVHRAKSLDLTSVALTDEDVLYGAIPFYQACEKAGIKPILGMVISHPLDDETSIPCILLAKTNVGYQQLIQISTHIQLNESFHMADYADDLVAIVSANTFPLQTIIQEERYDDLEQYITPLSQHFQQEDFYLGIESYEGLTNSVPLHSFQLYAESAPFNFTALHDVRYAKADDVTSYDCLQAMSANEKWVKKDRSQMVTGKHLRTNREMSNAFAEWPSLLESSNEIANKCNVTFTFSKQRLPSYPVPTDETASDYLRRLCKSAVEHKYAVDRQQEVEKRLTYELHIIRQLDFCDYFLIVADFVQYAKSKKIIVGPGRGSAAGSIVAYLLGITNVDPLEHNLLFERFLNPERVTMPDIDIDFSDNRRDEVIEYVYNKYGEDHVAQIITFGTFAARSILRELMKTMEIDRRDQAYILQHIPTQGNEPLLFYIEQSGEFQSYIKQSPKLRTLFSIALTLEGLPRHISTHAAGIVIGEKPLVEDVPLTRGSHDVHLTQYAMNELEAVGLLKIDVLGLRNLSMLERIIKSVEWKTGKTIDLDTLPVQDERTFELLQSGKTNGIFQLESSGMKNVLTSLLPTTLNDIIAINALYRPGPMDHIPTYIRRKHGEEQVRYLHPDLKPILSSTYGVLIYQEQIMQIAHQFAGLSLGEADILRRAISKKNRSLIDQQKVAFIQGCIHQGYKQQVAESLFAWIIKFANYGFNKSHSVAYSKISYQLSYLKAHYPSHFYAQLLSTVTNNANKLLLYIREANSMGIHILPPSINQSFAYYTVEGDHVRIGLMAVKGIGYETIKEIISERKKGLFKDLFDFCIRVTSIKRNVLETLILAGVFDETYANRASLLASIDQALDHAELFSGMGNQGTLFADKMNIRPSYIKLDDFTPMKKLTDEKEILNMYVSSHPLEQYRSTLTVQDVHTINAVIHTPDKSNIIVSGIVQAKRKIRTKRGESMAFLTVSDETGEIECVIFPNVYREVNSWLEEDEVVRIHGRVSTRQNQKQLIVNEVYQDNLETIQAAEQQKELYIQIVELKAGDDILAYLQSIATKYPGTTEIIIHDKKEKKTYKLEKQYHLHVNSDVLKLLQDYFGEKNVVLST